jgi:hypothetical protein
VDTLPRLAEEQVPAWGKSSPVSPAPVRAVERSGRGLLGRKAGGASVAAGTQARIACRKRTPRSAVLTALLVPEIRAGAFASRYSGLKLADPARFELTTSAFGG